MHARLKVLLVFALTAGAACAASRILVPDAVPVADSDRPQWYLQLAFVPRAVELTGVGAAVLILVSGLSAWLARWRAMPRN